MKKNLALLFIFIFLQACQTPPTKVTQTREYDIQTLGDLSKKPIEITDKTVVIDARRAFDFTMAHVPGSINIQWTEFAQKQGKTPGKLKRNLQPLVRRLAVYGIDKKSPVVVVGDGRTGSGEEGRLAWTLYYMGLTNVQFAHMDYFKTLTSQTDAPRKKSVRVWNTRPRKSIEIAKNDFLKIVTKGKQKLKKRIHIVDVRSEKEYFQKRGLGQGYSSPDIQAIHIPWTEFIGKNGRPNLKVKNMLRSIGVFSKDEIILISNNGVRSAAATMALLSLGYSKAKNYTGGFAELLSQ